MKKSRILISSLCLAGAVAALAAAAGCAKHTHTFSEDWASDETKHWHAATCEHTGEKQDESAHEYDEKYVCTVCGYQHEHNYDSNYVCTGCGYVVPDDGIVIVKETTEYYLDSSTTMSVPMDDFVVKFHKKAGQIAGDVADYSLKYYRYDEEIPNLNNVTDGSYNVWAKATVNGAETETFIIIRVIDEVKSIAVKPDEGTFEQNKGSIDKMSATWRFIVTYKSGRTKEVGSDIEEVDGEKLKIEGVDTSTVTEEGSAKVSFTVKYSNDKEQTVEVNVPYVIKQNSGAQTTSYTYSFEGIEATLNETDKAASSYTLSQANFTGDNAFLTVLNDKVVHRGPTNNVLEIKGDALSVTFAGTGTIVVKPRSTSGSNKSTFAIKDASGNYIAATYDTANTNIQKDDNINAYVVTGSKDSNELTFTIEAEGTYTICTLDSATVGGAAVATGRAARIDALTMTDRH